MDKTEKKKKKLNILDKKKCMIKSLHEINYFLTNFNKACTIKKFLKKL